MEIPKKKCSSTRLHLEAAQGGVVLGLPVACDCWAHEDAYIACKLRCVRMILVQFRCFLFDCLYGVLVPCAVYLPCLSGCYDALEP